MQQYITADGILWFLDFAGTLIEQLSNEVIDNSLKEISVQVESVNLWVGGIPYIAAPTGSPAHPHLQLTSSTHPHPYVLYIKQHTIKHDEVIKWKHFPRYWPFVRGIHRLIPLTKASDTELWWFLWSAPEDTDEFRRHRAHYGVTVMICEQVYVRIICVGVIQRQSIYIYHLPPACWSTFWKSNLKW